MRSHCDMSVRGIQSHIRSVSVFMSIHPDGMTYCKSEGELKSMTHCIGLGYAQIFLKYVTYTHTSMCISAESTLFQFPARQSQRFPKNTQHTGTKSVKGQFSSTAATRAEKRTQRDTIGLSHFIYSPSQMCQLRPFIWESIGLKQSVIGRGNGHVETQTRREGHKQGRHCDVKHR